ncbi:MAG: hypothetical protein A2V77_24180 [Anaeromyxobacter sp. RBG_16_69_14]|nr:MAG: hypothetical protein A2V77_24180 [Anaeromyxobacter sp. RBG_16_69_14]
MARLSVSPEYVAALVEAGFCPHVVRGLIELEVYRRPAHDRWFLQAQVDNDGHIDVGLTQDAGWGAFIGPIHRAESASALARALPEIVRSLEELATADYRLRCPRCNSWTVMRNGKNGPFLSCTQLRKAAESSDEAVTCQGTLRMTALYIHRENADGAPDGDRPHEADTR